MTDYASIAAQASEALKANGYTATLLKAQAVDESGDLPAFVDLIPHTVTVLRTKLKISDKQGSNADMIETAFLLDPLAGVVPENGDKLTLPQGTFSILYVEGVGPGGLDVLYKVMCSGAT